ncbi:unnamed protein product [Discosporangium mesarthrocarpum]
MGEATFGTHIFSRGASKVILLIEGLSERITSRNITVTTAVESWHSWSYDVPTFSLAGLPYRMPTCKLHGRQHRSYSFKCSSTDGPPWWPGSNKLLGRLQATVRAAKEWVVSLHVSTSWSNSVPRQDGVWFGGVTLGGGGGGNGSCNNTSMGWAWEGARGRPGYGGVPVHQSSKRWNGASTNPLTALVIWFSGVWGLYAVLLTESPIVTKALTAGAIAVCGDLVAQAIEQRQDDSEPQLTKDKRRLLAVACDGLFVTGPGLHALYGALERLLPTSGGAGSAAVHVLIDTFVFDPLFVGSFFLVTGALERRSLIRDILPSMKR